MVKIVEDFIPGGRRNRPGYRMDPRYITIHDTANTQAGADAAAHAHYVKTAPDLIASWHFTVDDGLIYQHLPLNENGWHAGDGTNGTGNRESIGIEICENRDGDRATAESNAAWLTAGLLRDFELGLDRVKQHYDWNGNNCPRVLRGRKNGWAGFLEAVDTYLTEGEPQPVPDPEPPPAPVPEPSPEPGPGEPPGETDPGEPDSPGAVASFFSFLVRLFYSFLEWLRRVFRSR